MLLSLFSVFVAIRGVANGVRPSGNDLTIYLDAARSVLRGRSPMEAEGWLYPPCAALLFVPLCRLPTLLAATLWGLGSLSALAFVVHSLARSFRVPGRPSRAWLLWLPAWLVARPIDSNFGNGQINLVVLAAVVAGVCAVERGRERRGAIWFGIAAALKVLPGIFLLQLLLNRRFRAFGLGLAVSAALFFLAPLPLRGRAGVLEDTRSWWEQVVEPSAVGAEEWIAAWPRTPGQSLTGAIYRLSRVNPASLLEPRGERNEEPSREALNRARLRIRLAVLALLSLLALPMLVSPTGPKDPVRRTDHALCATTALLVAPIVHKAHFVWLLLPLSILAREGFDPRASRGRRIAIWGCVAWLGLCVSGLTPALVGKHTAAILVVYSVFLIGLLPLHAWLLAERWSAVFRRRCRGFVPSD